MRRNHERSERVCEEALLQMRQGKLHQPRRLLEAALRDDPYYLPTRIALVELAILESNPTRAIRESKRATSIALLRCREAGLRRGDYAKHVPGQLLLRALVVGGRAHMAAGELNEAINAFAVVLHEDPDDTFNVCMDLSGLFLAQGRPEGVLGLYRLGYTHGANFLDVCLAALMSGNLDVAFIGLIQALQEDDSLLEVAESLVLPSDADEAPASEYAERRRPVWVAVPRARGLVRKMLEHPIVQRTLELMDELDADPDPDADELAETRTKLFDNLRSEAVVNTVVNSLAR